MLREHNESALEIQDPSRFPNRLSAKLEQLYRSLAQFLEGQEDASFRTEVEAQLTRCREFIVGIDQFTRKLVPVRSTMPKASAGSVSLHATPLNVPELLSELLFHQDFPVILCSATLTVRNSFDYYTGRTGFCNGRTLLLDSPFGADQARVYIPRDMPDPKDDGYQAALRAGGAALRRVDSGQGVRAVHELCLAAPDGGRPARIFPRQRVAAAGPGGEYDPFRAAARVQGGYRLRAVRHRQLLDRRGCSGESLSNVIVTRCRSRFRAIR